MIKGKPRVWYILSKYKRRGSDDILTFISEHVTLVQLMDYLGNVNHAISDIRYWMFDSNYNKALVLNRELLNMICSPSVVEEQVAVFETLFTAVRYILSTAYLEK